MSFLVSALLFMLFIAIGVMFSLFREIRRANSPSHRFQVTEMALAAYRAHRDREPELPQKLFRLWEACGLYEAEQEAERLRHIQNRYKQRPK